MLQPPVEITEADEKFEAWIETIEGALLTAEHQVEQLTEASLDAERLLARDALGWAPLGDLGDGVMPLAKIREFASRARVQALTDPLIRRGRAIRRTYCWSGGVQITARDAGDTGQDVNAVLQAFIDDQETTFTGAQARHEHHDTLMDDGNLFLALPTNPLTGRVQVRAVPMDDITDIITNPDDAAEPWFYRRQRAVRSVRIVTLAGSTDRATETVTETVTTWHPALGFRPNQRIKTLDGYRVDWDTPILHASVNRPQGSLWGTSDLLAAMPWSRGYAEFLTDWATLVKALSKLAFKTTAGKGSKAPQVRQQIESSAVIGGTAVLGPDQDLQAIGKSGATIDSNSGRPLAAMVAAALDVPVTMLLSDPGVTGARATAETLDRPLTEAIGARREIIEAYTRRILDHVIDQAIKAPRGPLTGTVRIDPTTGREVIALAGDQDRSIEFAWPELDGTPVAEQIAALVAADGTEKVPPVVIAKALLAALDIDNADEVLKPFIDDQGQLIPFDTTDALAAVAAGDYPTGV